jgi:hypothetical protein
VLSKGGACVAALLAVLAIEGRARAQDDAMSDARALFERGVALAAEQRWTDALDAFRASRALVERPSTVYNIATTLQRLGRVREAIQAVDDYLAIADPVADAAQREQASQLRGVLAASLAHVVIEVSPENAEIAIDGRPTSEVGARRELVADPGEHVVLVSAGGHETERLELALASGARVVQAVSLAPIPVSRSIAEEPVFWVVLLGVVAGAAVAIAVPVAIDQQPRLYQGTTGSTVEALRF